MTEQGSALKETILSGIVSPMHSNSVMPMTNDLTVYLALNRAIYVPLGVRMHRRLWEHLTRR